MPSFHVFLDTSVLPRHPGHLPVGFERLSQLVENGLVQCHLSVVAVNEWKSHLAEDFANVVNEAKQPLTKLLKHPWASRIQGWESIQVAGASLSRASVNEIVEAKFRELLEKIQANVLPVSAHHGSLIVENYFAGLPPFEKTKNRDDFPDAFIFQCASDLAGASGEGLHCIVADKNLKGKLAQVHNVRVYANIDDFVQSEPVVSAVGQQRQEQIWRLLFAKLGQWLPEQSDHLSNELERLIIDKLATTEISHPGIPDDNHEAYISAVGSPVNTQFKWDGIRDFGPGLVTLPVNFECEVEIDFNVYRGEAFEVPDGVWVEFADPEENHYFDAGGTVELLVACTMSLGFDTNGLTEESIPNLLRVDIDSIVNVEVKEHHGYIFSANNSDWGQADS